MDNNASENRARSRVRRDSLEAVVSRGPEPSPVNDAVAAIFERLVEMDDVVADLTCRLEPVLSPNGEPPEYQLDQLEEKGSLRPRASSLVAHQLREIQARVTDATCHIRAVIDRLET